MGIWLASAVSGASLGLVGPAVVVAILWVAPLASARARLMRTLAMVMMLGALRLGVADRGAGSIRGQCAPLVDTRGGAQVVGVVSGPILDRPGSRQFVVRGPGGVRVLVNALGQAPPAVLPGDRVRVVGRLRSARGYRVPGAIDWARWLRSRGADLRMSAVADRVTVVAAAAQPSAWRLPARLQRASVARVNRRGGPVHGRAVVRAMVLGDRGALDDDVAAAFRDAGVSHVLAVSGLHLAVVAMLLFVATRRLWGLVPSLVVFVSPVRAAALASASGAIVFALVTGGRVSTLRALAVTLLVLFGLVTARRVRLVDVLAVAAIGLLAINPSTLFDPGFQLSFAATTTLVLVFTDRGSRSPVRWRRVLNYVVDLGRASMWATLATLPFTAVTFHTVAPAGVLANIVVVPLAELVVLPVGLFGVVLDLCIPGAGGPLIDVAIVFAWAIAELAAGFAAWLPAWHVPAPRWWELCAIAAAWLAAVAWRRRWLRPRTCAAVAVVAVVSVASSWLITSYVQPARRSHLRVVFLDVGQGDAAVIELPGGATWLVDAGGRPFVLPRPGESSRSRLRRAAEPGSGAVLRYLQHRRVRRLDLVIVSHPHPDHFMGLYALARVVPISELWVARPPPGADSLGPYARLIDLLRRKGTRVVHPALGLSRDRAGVVVRTLHPKFAGATVAAADPTLSANDNSLTVAVEFAGRRVLFAGDVEVAAETQLVDAGGLRADVVKVPHHGSPTSSTAAFVRAVAPEFAVVSCGLANRFGFPSAEVMARWRSGGAQVLRTDVHGSVTVDISRSGHLRVTTFDVPSRCATSD